MMPNDGVGDSNRNFFGNYWLENEYSPEHNASRVQNVWQCNLAYEIARIKEVAKTYSYIALDTEYPGNIILSSPGSRVPYYIYMKDNTNVTKLIQLGLTFMNDNGELASGPFHTWQFNFHFDLKTDTHAIDSITLLSNAGIDFETHAAGGICHQQFAALLLESGILGSNQLSWILFQGSFDLAYLVRMFIGYDLPALEWQFLAWIKQFFPILYDVKLMMSICCLHGGLDTLATQFNIAREGTAHQAGSDALLTGQAFFMLRRMYFGDNLDTLCGRIYGLRGNTMLKACAATTTLGPTYPMPKSED